LQFTVPIIAGELEGCFFCVSVIPGKDVQRALQYCKM